MRLSRLRGALPLIGLLCLAACGAASSDRPAVLIDKAAGINPCQDIVVRPYTRAEQAQVADELDAAPAAAKWPDFVRDYGVMRAAVRACQGH